MINKTLIIWDTDIKSDDFVQQLVAILQTTDAYVVRNQKMFDEFHAWKDVEGVVILAELAWEGKRRTDFWGFDLIQKMRNEKRLTVPISIASFISKEKFATSVYAKNKGEIVKAPGHNFHHLPVPFAELAPKGITLTKDLLEDICYSFIDFRGMAHEIIHNLKNQLELSHKEWTPVEIVSHAKDAINESFRQMQNFIHVKYAQEFERVKTMTINEIEASVKDYLERHNRVIKGYNEAMLIISRNAEQVYKLLPIDIKDDAVEESSRKHQWQALFIDDEKSYRESVKEHFERRGVTCKAVSNLEEAKNTLNEDKKGKISVLITDIRLLNEDGTWQDKQGYDILNEIYHEKGINALAYYALTSKKGTILRNLKDRVPFAVKWFAKDDVVTTEQSFNLFCNEVIEQGEKFYYRNKSQPKGTSWTDGLKGRFTYPLSQLYRKHLESTDYAESEVIINDKVKKYIEQIANNEKISSEVGFTGTIVDEIIDAHTIKKFRDMILVGRRLVLGLVNAGYKKEQIEQLLLPERDENDERRKHEKKEAENRKKILALESEILALKETDGNEIKIKEKESNLRELRNIKFEDVANQQREKLLFNTTLVLSSKYDLVKDQNRPFLNSHLLEEEILFLQSDSINDVRTDEDVIEWISDFLLGLRNMQQIVKVNDLIEKLEEDDDNGKVTVSSIEALLTEAENRFRDYKVEQKIQDLDIRELKNDRLKRKIQVSTLKRFLEPEGINI